MYANCVHTTVIRAPVLVVAVGVGRAFSQSHFYRLIDFLCNVQHYTAMRVRMTEPCRVDRIRAGVALTDNLTATASALDHHTPVAGLGNLARVSDTAGIRCQLGVRLAVERNAGLLARNRVDGATGDEDKRENDDELLHGELLRRTCRHHCGIMEPEILSVANATNPFRIRDRISAVFFNTTNIPSPCDSHYILPL